MLQSTNMKLEHELVVSLVNAFGYPDSPEGICHGIAMMYIHAVLLGEEELKKFYSRLQFLNEYKNDLNRLTKLINEAKELSIAETKTQEYKDWSLAHNSWVKNKIGSEPRFVTKLDPIHVQALDVQPFLEGIAVYIQPQYFSELFNKTLKQMARIEVSKFMQPESIEKEGGLVELFSACNVYNKDTLRNYLDEIKRNVIDNKLKNTPILVGSVNHAIAITYDLDINGWRVLDANMLSSEMLNKKFTNTAEISEQIMRCMEGDGYGDNKIIYTHV